MAGRVSDWALLKTGISVETSLTDHCADGSPRALPASRALPALTAAPSCYRRLHGGKTIFPSESSLLTQALDSLALVWALGYGGHVFSPLCVFQIFGFIVTSLSVCKLHLQSPVLCLLCLWNNVQICHSPCHCSLRAPSLFLHPSTFDSALSLSSCLSKTALSREHKISSLSIDARKSKFKLSTAYLRAKVWFQRTLSWRHSFAYSPVFFLPHHRVWSKPDHWQPVDLDLATFIAHGILSLNCVWVFAVFLRSKKHSVNLL